MTEGTALSARRVCYLVFLRPSDVERDSSTSLGMTLFLEAVESRNVIVGTDLRSQPDGRDG